MFRGEMVLAIEGRRSYGGDAFLEELPSGRKGLSGHALQGVFWNDARNDCGKVRVGRNAFSLRLSVALFS